MSKCISSEGEFSEHALGTGGNEFTCTRCWALDGAAIHEALDACREQRADLLELVAATEVKAWRDAADKVDTGPTFPLLPSIISTLLREHADALEVHYATRVNPSAEPAPLSKKSSR